MLSWTYDPANTAGYQVFYSLNPYFQIGDGSDTLVPVPTGATWTHAGALSDDSKNYCYLVRGVTAGGQPSAPSAKICEFTFGLIPGVP